MDMERRVGLTPEGRPSITPRGDLIRSIVFKLAAMGFGIPDEAEYRDMLQLGRDLFARYREQSRLLSDHLTPVDRRIQTFLDRQFASLSPGQSVRLPVSTFILDRHGLARELSFPLRADVYHNQYISSFRTNNGVMHNPATDRRTTQGVFHVAEGGLPIPADKIAVPLATYAHMLREAFNAPSDLLRLPFSEGWASPVETMVSLLLRPLVCPAVPGGSPAKRMEMRFFAPASLVSNLDFVESIFANAGDPYLPENDAGLDVHHWTGHTGAVVLAPHLTRLRKKDVGLPHIGVATAAQKASGMCWNRDDELYNDGRAFKLTARDMDGVMVTIVADNYFGYCKKEVKTQIGFSANLFGLAEEEHAGGALAFPSWVSGDHFVPDARLLSGGHRFADVLSLLGDGVVPHPSGYATDRQYPTVHYLPEGAEIELHKQDIHWPHQGEQQHLRLLPGHVYVYPSGHKMRMEKHPAAPSWRLVETSPEGTFCHKPCTVSGGGKSEISKSLIDAVLYGPIYINDFDQDMALANEIFARDYTNRFAPSRRTTTGPSRRLLSPKRSLGSVIKLLTPSDSDYTPEYNVWLRKIPNHIRAVVFLIKRFYKAEWDDWRNYFSVDAINGAPGHELKFEGRKLVGSYLRIGVESKGGWRTFKLRQDFVSADKVQMEDDISASVVVPASDLFGLPASYDRHPSVKLVENCEWRLFQRPDAAIEPGFDRQTEADMSDDGNFLSNFQPLRAGDVQDIIENAPVFDAFTPPMQRHLVAAALRPEGYAACSANPRLVGGKPSKNPRYLQTRPDVSRPRDRYLANIGARLHRRIPPDREVVFAVHSVLSGRRNNPPEPGVRPLCVYSPIHYQELPELFMDYICSLTGKSPSTTGAGSEGALTKGPFNALCATADLNNLLVAMLLTGYGGFSTAAGWIGPQHEVEHDVSVLIPELWCRLSADERDPIRMMAEGYLEPIADFVHEGTAVLASRLGYRITAKFVRTYLGRVFDNPTAVFTDDLLKPELQDASVFADGVRNIVEAQQRVALSYFEDGSIATACPPIRVLLHIMAHGHFEGKDVHHPDVRALFTRAALVASSWYAERLALKQRRDVALWQRHVKRLSEFLVLPGHRDEVDRLRVADRLEQARAELQRVQAPEYLRSLTGTIGADPIALGVEGAVGTP